MRSIARFAFALLLAALLTPAPGAPAGEFTLLDYHTLTDWLPETPGASAGAVGGFINPAAWSTTPEQRPEFALWWDDRSPDDSGLGNWGFAVAGDVGFGVNTRQVELDGRVRRVTDYQWGLSGGDRRGRLGVAYRWRGDDGEALGRENSLVVGLLSRPGRFLSIGASGNWSVETRARQGVFDLGIRPLGDDRLTLYGDYTLDTTDKLDDGRWGAGALIRPVRGLMLGVTAREAPETDDIRWVGNLGVNLASVGFHWLPGFNADGDHDANTWLIRSDTPSRDLAAAENLNLLPQPNVYAAISLENKYLTYQRYQYLDERRVAWLDLSNWLDTVSADPRIDGVALNLTDFRARPSLAWELRARLQGLRDQGKEVVIHVGRVGMMEMYLASVADRLSMDPEGDLVLQGFASGRTYFADMLDKLGLGYQELRYFKYKSAAEGGSRMDMSEGEREQRQRMVDVIYEQTRAAICEARGLTVEQFDELADGRVGMAPAEAEKLGLVDAVGRDADLKKWLRVERGAITGQPALAARADAYPEEQWGEPPHIAVVYAVGACDMDTGIKGRTTARYLEGLVTNRDVRAVVLRVDSPGGDPLPSDLVAGAVRRLIAAGKPVIVSQGDVAASGGYWLSMDGDEVLTTPLTVTGSIGVIAAWVYDDTAGDKVGLAYDGVKRGAHADLMQPVRDPLLGIAIPHRAMDEQELDLVRDYIMEAYDGFVAKVAAGRDLDEERVRELAQGRVWMGGDALEHGLCDGFGGLGDAIAAARTRAGIDAGRHVTVTEYPPRPLIDLSGLLGGGNPLSGFPFGLGARVHRAVDRLAAMTPMLPGDEAAVAFLPSAATLVGPDARLAADPDSFDAATWYLRSLDGAMGRPRMAVTPADLPAGWGRPD
jgi:protease-4